MADYPTIPGMRTRVFVYDAGTLSWIPYEPADFTGGGGGGSASEATLLTRLSESDFDTKTGSLTEGAPASDTASSGLNGRLQRIAQRITSLMGLFPTSLGQTTSANSLAVVVASDQSTLPVSAASLPLPSGAATEATLSTLNGKVTAVNTGAVVVSSSALPTGAATAALQTQPGVDIGDVTINNASGASAVHVQDGGNSLTVDGTVGVNNFPATQAISAAALPLPSNAAQETGGNLASILTELQQKVEPADLASLATAALQTTGNVSLASIDTKLTSPISVEAKGLVGDAAQAYLDGEVQPLSLTSDGRLRVVTSPTTNDQIWQYTFLSYPRPSHPHAGQWSPWLE